MSRCGIFWYFLHENGWAFLPDGNMPENLSPQFHLRVFSNTKWETLDILGTTFNGALVENSIELQRYLERTSVGHGTDFICTLPGVIKLFAAGGMKKAK